MLNKNRVGLAFGVFLAIVHAVWALLIAVVPVQFQKFLNWLFLVHALEPYWMLTQFVFLNAVLLVAVTFVFGYIFGYLFAAIFDMMHKASTPARRRIRKRRR